MTLALLVEDALANVRAIWDSAAKLDPGLPVFAEVSSGEDGASRISGGVTMSLAEKFPKVWSALAAVVPHPYVLEFVKSTPVELVTLNIPLAGLIIDTWAEHSAGELNWLKSYPIKELRRQDLSLVYAKTFKGMLRIDDILPKRQWPTRCETLNWILKDCHSTRAAWSRTLPLSQPVRVKGRVVPGFQRGSKELGCPTANVENAEALSMESLVLPGTYKCRAALRNTTYDAVVSVGFNPYYANSQMTIEVHIFHAFDHDFYEEEIEVLIEEFLRAESDFREFNELIFAIQMDCEILHTRV